MLEQLKYKNHVNEVFEFGKDGIFVDMNDLRDYEWTVTTKNNRVAALSYAPIKKKLPVIIICETEEQGIAARNRLFEVVEKDVLAMQHGKIIIGNYYFKCFVTKAQKSNYLTTKRHVEVMLTLVSDFPFWVKETAYAFSSNKGQSADATGDFDYPLDYPFDYYSQMDVRELNNTGFAASNFKMIIYGPCSNPTIYVSGHTYRVNCNVGVNEYLTIDAVSKKIFLTANDGSVTNVFNLRNRDAYIFEKIPTGKNFISWEGDIKFDIILMEERSEPKWT